MANDTERVRNNEIEILSYLNKEGIEFAFGSMGNLLELAQDVKKQRAYRYCKKYRRLNTVDEIIANYITFDEAMDVTSPKVLNKFITPYGKR